MGCAAAVHWVEARSAAEGVEAEEAAMVVDTSAGLGTAARPEVEGREAEAAEEAAMVVEAEADLETVARPEVAMAASPAARVRPEARVRPFAH